MRPYTRALFRLIQMFAGRQVGIFFEVIRSQRLADGVFLGEPFAQIYQLAALRAKRTVFSIKPRAHLAARRAFDLERLAHVQSSATHFQADRI